MGSSGHICGHWDTKIVKMDGRFMEKLWFHPTSDRKIWENLGVAPKLYGTMVILTNKSLGKLMKHIWDTSTNIWHLSNHGWTWSQPTIEVKNPDLTIAMCRDPIRIIASAKVKQLACLLLCLSMFIHPLVNIQIAIENCHRNSWFTHRKLWFSVVM
jgi:hypothetical protein